MTSASEAIWARASTGKHTLVLGVTDLEPPDEPSLRVVHVDCGARPRPLGPLFAVHDALVELVKETHAPPLVDPTSVSRRLFNEDVEAGGASAIVPLAEQLRRQSDTQLVVWLDGVDEADADTLRVLCRLVAGPGGLHFALLLTTKRMALSDTADELARVLTEACGIDAVMRLEAETITTVPPPPVDLEDMPFEVMRVLRAGATVGDAFEIDVVAQLLGIDPLTALELVQMAFDSGAPLRDSGDGMFRLPASFADEIRAGITPSLGSAWHRVLAELLHEPSGLAREDSFEPLEAVPPLPMQVRAPTLERVTAEETDVDSEPIAGGQRARDRASVGDLAARSAEHAEAAGERHDAAERYLSAAQQAAAIGGYKRATDLAQRVLRLGSRHVSNKLDRQLSIRALLELGRTSWLAAGAEGGGLSDALDPLDKAAAMIGPDDPVELRAEVGALLARVHYDIGDAEGFERALAALGQGRRALLDAGKPLSAARLLNDEAAIRARMGELAAASELLDRSRGVFARVAGDNPVARFELAETDHLAARLVLHAPRDAQRNVQILDGALERARAAERAFSELGAARETSRTWETMGRLLRLAERLEEATHYLSTAAEMQHKSHDTVGLARTTAALSELLADAGRPREALDVLADSVALNMQTGSRQGLIYNRQGLEELSSRLGSSPDPGLVDALSGLRARLEAGAW